jgi:hypothetical protein
MHAFHRHTSAPWDLPKHARTRRPYAHSVPYFPVQYDSAADARAQRQHTQGIELEFSSLTRHTLGERCAVRVVFYDHGSLEPALKLLPQLKVLPARQIRRLEEASLGQFHWPRSSNTDANTLLTDAQSLLQRLHRLAEI